MDEIAQREKKKYDRLWQSVPSYRTCSLGELFLPHFFGHFSLEEGDRILDFGCGSGRCAKAFLEKGMSVHLIDFCIDALDPEIHLLATLCSDRLIFTEACLWDLPKELKAGEWIYCCDVMEHIPESQVDKVLYEMSLRMKKGGYLSICLQEDQFGQALQEPLHVTIQPKEWWIERLSAWFLIEQEMPFCEGVYFNCFVRPLYT